MTTPQSSSTFSYDQVLEESKKYFGDEELPAKVFVDKYALRNAEGEILESTPEMMHQRLAKEFARIDSEKYGLNYQDRFNIYFDALKDFARIVPQGSPMSAVGNIYQRISASNCVVVESPKDSMGGIIDTGKMLAQLYKRRAGVGLDISTLRPEDFPVSNAARTTSGAWSFADFYSYITRMVGQCIASGERVLTHRGLVNIEDVVSGQDKVWTKIGWVQVKNVLANGKKKIYKLTTANGYDICASEDHIFLTEKDGNLTEIKMKDLNPEDSIVLIPGTSNQQYIYADLKKFEYVVKTHNNSNRLNRDVEIPTKLTEDLAYILGYSYGDGHVTFDKFGEPVTLSLACGHKYPDIEKKIISLIKTIFDYEAKIYQGDGKVNNVEIHSKCILSHLKNNFLLKEKANRIKIPFVIFTSPSSVQNAFLAGFFDADGYASGKKRGYVFSTICHEFAKDIQTLLMANGVISKIHSEDRSNKNWQTLYNVCVTGATSQKKFITQTKKWSTKIDNCNHISKRDNYLTPYKAKTLNVAHNRFDYIPDNSQYISASAYSKLKEEKIVSDNILIQDSVLYIDELAIPMETFDLQLEEEHLFWCEGFYVHNSGRRGALMVTLSVHHPDVLKFTTMKHDKTKVTGANISLRLSDEFLQAVEADTDYQLRWPVEDEIPKFTKNIRARDVWDVIIKSATLDAEPGLIMWDNMINNLPAHCYPEFKTSSTNPCCFDKDQDIFVITKDGIKEIKTITNDDLIWIDSESIWTRTSGYFNAGQQEVYKITLSNNESFNVTNNHKFEILSPKRIGTKIEYVDRRLVELKDIQPGDRIACATKEVEISNNLGSFEDGLILGWLSGDGCLSYKNERDVFPTTYLAFWNQEHDVADKLLNIVRQQGFNIDLQSYESNGNIIKRIVSSELTSHLTYKYKTNLWKFKIGFNQFLYYASKNFVKGYLSSYFSADGTVECVVEQSRYNIQLGSVDKDRLDQVRNLLILFGIKSSVGKSTDECITVIRGREYNCKKLYRLTISGISNIRKFSDKIGFISDKKQEKLKCILNNSLGVEKQRDYVKVESITLLGTKQVGCIEVDNYHKFTANGIISGNSEIALSAYDSCRLISINLTGYVLNPFQKDAHFDWATFVEDIKTAQQMADNLVDLEIELIDRIKEVCEPGSETELWNNLQNAGRNGRRTGLGTHGLADTLAQLCIKYDSDEALEKIDNIYSTLRDVAYQTSIDLAKERGAFPVYDFEQEKDCAFIKRLPVNLIKQMKKHGRRNIAILTQAPTGSVSLLSKVGKFNRWNVSSGIEPVFKNFYIRRKKINPSDKNARIDFTDIVGDSWQEFKVYHANVQNYLEFSSQEELPDYFVTSDQIDWGKRVKLQGIEQQYLDHSISSTINLPRDTSPEIVGNLYLNAWKHGLKGVTVYVEGSRDGVLVTDNSQKEKNNNGRPKKILPAHAPARPKDLPCEIHKATVKGTKWTVIVGLLDGDPYELFMGHADILVVPNKVVYGVMSKNGKGKYTLSFDTGKGMETIDDVIKTCNDNESAWATRMISTSLRHGVPVEFLVEQLSKDGSVVDINMVLARILRKYAKNGSVKCPDCGSTQLIFRTACFDCMSCGKSGCS